MRLKLLVVGSLAIAFVAVGSAQTRGAAPSAQPASAMKFAGTMECPAAPPAGMVDVGDTPGHALVLIKAKCTWTKGDMSGVKLTSEEDAGVSEMTSATASKDMGYGVSTLANGDKAFVKFQGSGTYKAGNPPALTTASGTFSFTGGTGKMKGLKGNGTYKGVFKADGSVTWTIDGTYSVPGGK